jgi:hypothetical protein
MADYETIVLRHSMARYRTCSMVCINYQFSNTQGVDVGNYEADRMQIER